MRIHAYTLDRGGCLYYRVKHPLKAIRALGHYTSWGSGADLETHHRADVLIGQILATPRQEALWTQWCAKWDKLCVWDSDDDIFTCHQNPAHGPAYDDPETLDRCRRMISASHLVTVSTPALADIYRDLNDHVVVLRNAIPPELILKHPPEQPTDFTITYTGSPSHANDFADWSRIGDRWWRRHPRTILSLYGTDRPVGLPRTLRTKTTPWVKLTEEYLPTITGTVGIAPLRRTVFNQGKSGIKAQEYAARGIPAICADFPQYRDVVDDGITGFIENTAGGWLDALESLHDTPGLWSKMSAAAVNKAANEFAVNPHNWVDVYRHAATRIGVTL